MKRAGAGGPQRKKRRMFNKSLTKQEKDFLTLPMEEQERIFKIYADYFIILGQKLGRLMGIPDKINPFYSAPGGPASPDSD